MYPFSFPVQSYISFSNFEVFFSSLLNSWAKKSAKTFPGQAISNKAYNKTHIEKREKRHILNTEILQLR